jgi:hypothetical protein
MNTISKEFTVFDPSALQSDLESVGPRAGEINPGDRIVGVLLSEVSHGERMQSK